jgi:UDP-N-acetylglucosamine acyltransferase
MTISSATPSASDGAPVIHPSAVVDPGAVLEEGVNIGPFCVVGPNVRLGRNVQLHSHVVVEGHTAIGEGTKISAFAALGTPPQDLKYRGEDTHLEIGCNNIIREHVTMNPGTTTGRSLTRVGDHNMFMVGAHIAHDCVVGNRVIFANNATLAGHCKVEDHAILGGLCAVHQFARIGAYAFIGGMSGVENDVIPYGMALGNRARLAGLNVVGLKRNGFSREQIHQMRQAFRLLFAEEHTLPERLGAVEEAYGDEPAVQRILSFVRTESNRPLCLPRHGVNGASQ